MHPEEERGKRKEEREKRKEKREKSAKVKGLAFASRPDLPQLMANILFTPRYFTNHWISIERYRVLAALILGL